MTTKITVKALKKLIKHKFGKITTFTSLIGMDHYAFTMLMSASTKNMTDERQEEIQRLAKLVRTTKVEPTKDELTLEIRKRMKQQIDERFGGIPGFCIDNPAFRPNSVWHIIEGRRKRIGPMVKKILTILEQ